MTGAGLLKRMSGGAPITDPEGKYSTGIPDFDRLMGGGFRRGSFALFNLEGPLTTEDIHLLLTPTWLNFLRQSRGMLAVLPARESPAQFRTALLQHVTRRLFDSRVRIVDYIGESDPFSYVVTMGPKLPKAKAMRRMVEAERAIHGARGRPFIEYNALEMMEGLFTADTACRMILHGVKRARLVGNLGLALARPGLACVEAARSMMDYDFRLRRTPDGLQLVGDRPAFPAHFVLEDPRGGRPRVRLRRAAS